MDSNEKNISDLSPNRNFQNISNNMKKVFVSIVMPCLNEEETIGICVEKAVNSLKKMNVDGEVVVSDNGSTDRSVEIAKQKGARVVFQKKKGYGNAYLKGLDEAKGDILIMADSDNTYDFSDLEPFIKPITENGYDMVMGSRLKGKILPGSMPWLHRYIGNPFLSWFLNVLFHTNISDSHCGMRSFTKSAYKKMHLVMPGMEFASEMVIKASKAGLKIAEHPIIYYPREGRSKLHSFRDGWRHLRFMLMYSPTHLFLIPGLLCLVIGLLFTIALFPGPIKTKWHTFDIHFMVLGSMLAILGYQILNLGLYAKAISYEDHFAIQDGFIKAFYKIFSLEKGVIIGSILTIAGFILEILILHEWIKRKMGPLYETRQALVGMTLIILGVQTIFSSFILSMTKITQEEEG